MSQSDVSSWSRRIKMIMRSTTLLLLVGMFLCASVGAVVFFYLSLPTTLKIAVGPPKSDDTKVIQAIAAKLSRDHASVRLRPVIKDGGPPIAAAAMDAEQVDLAVVRRDTGMSKEGQVVAILRKNVAVFIVPAPETMEPATTPPAVGDAKVGFEAEKQKTEKIEKIDDIVGKRLAVVGRSQANLDVLRAILLQYDIHDDKILELGAESSSDASKINVIHIDPNNILQAVRDAKPDVILSVGPVGSENTAAAIAAATRGKQQPTFLAISAAEAIAERTSAYESTEIKAGAFGGSPPRPEESVATVGFNHYIVANKKLSEDTIAEFTRLLLTMRTALAAEAPTAAKIEAPDTEKGAPVPVHPGAAAYIDGEVKTFFDRYSDLLYWGLMIIYLVGSGLAGLASYTKSGDRTHRLKVLVTLLDLNKAARSAASIQKLDELQVEVDQVLAGMIEDIEGNALDDTAMAAFTVMLNQAQTALSNRRATLLGQPLVTRAADASPQPGRVLAGRA